MQLQIIFIFIIYQILQILLVPFLIVYLIIRKAKKKPVFGSLKQRLGFVKKTKSNKKIIWIHAVSVGEILSIQNLIDQVKEKIKNISVYVTTGTLTGKKIAQQNLNYDYLSFLPFDFLPTMFLAFKRIKPNTIIIVEAETWPNLLMFSKFFKVPIYLLNARISNRSKPKYHKLKFFFKPLFNIFKLIFVQSKIDKSNFKNLGINSEKLRILGNLKALNVLVKKEKLHPFKPKIKYPTLLVGSLHPGELDIYLNLFEKLKKDFKNLKLILAPRHFHWKKELIEKVEQSKFDYYLWEKEKELSLNNISNNIFKEHDILLVCKLGELFKLYQICNLFFLGGTFVPVGGHNLLEPAVWAKLSIIGSYYQNCKDIADKLEKENCLIKVKNEQELLAQTRRLLNNPETLEKMENQAYSWLVQQASLVQKNLNVLIEELKQ